MIERLACALELGRGWCTAHEPRPAGSEELGHEVRGERDSRPSGSVEPGRETTRASKE